MINERHQVSGIPVSGGERVIGYYSACIEPMDEPVLLYYITDIENNSTVVFPDTVEPVRVKPIFVPDLTLPDMIYCPNCNYDLMGGIETDAEHDPPYCWECGMALDWPKRQ